MKRRPDALDAERCASCTTRRGRFYRWSLRVRPDVTRALPHHPQCSPEGCSCEACRNFVAAREVAYPPEFREKLALLGLDYHRETEVTDYGLVEGRVLYHGWFNFVGRVERGAYASIPCGQGGMMLDLVPITKDFSAGIVAPTEAAIAHDPPFLQLEFLAKVPWVIEAAAADGPYAKKDS